ncbi:MAG: endonuclease V [Thermoguttaceae bacterium]
MSRRRHEGLPLPLPDLPRCLQTLLRQVPPGRLTTYGNLALALGSPAAARWVGHWMLHHDHGPECCCHRVVRSDGSLGGYAGGEPTLKAQRLRAEGILLHDDRVADVAGNAFRDFNSTEPLAALSRLQLELASKVRLRGRTTMPATLAGVDVSYSGRHATGAYVLWDVSRAEIVWSTTVTRQIDFPYITGYLSFRELPVLLALLESAANSARLADVLIVDGSGVLHPRGIGIACHLGVVASIPAIGVSKRLLAGQVDLKDIAAGESRPVVLQGRRLGAALRPTPSGRRPIFISPGHRIGVDMAEKIVRSQLLGRRLPEVQYWADRLSRSAGRSAF